ncbi:MAG: type II toxin-antitoxin system VapC family toxin [Desulfurococcales archaeon]|nr:type II toxin-antitoxin system VapC family toxin [Desulfurococcales archaeon]
MRVYLDTSVIISYIDEADANHERALRFLEGLQAELAVSRLTLVELASVYARAGLEEPEALALYSIRRTGATLWRVDFNEVLAQAYRLAGALRLRSLDLLHVTAAKAIGANAIATLDKDIIAKAERLEDIGLKVLAP